MAFRSGVLSFFLHRGRRPPRRQSFLPRDSRLSPAEPCIGASSTQHTVVVSLHLALQPLSYSLRRFAIAFRYLRVASDPSSTVRKKEARCRRIGAPQSDGS